MKLEDFQGEWLLSSGEWSVEYIEFRAKGKRPLVLNNPSFGGLVYKLAGYLNVKLPIVEYAIQRFLLIDTPEPPTIEDRFYANVTILGLERLLSAK